jgi:hypothetical protein
VEPAWVNGFLPGLDAAALYGMLALQPPETYLEVGSGNSTRFARRRSRTMTFARGSSRSILTRGSRSTRSRIA